MNLPNPPLLPTSSEHACPVAPVRLRRLVALSYLALAAIAVADGAVALNDSTLLADMDLEQLVNLEITSVSKKEMRLFDSPAAISVVTSEDLRRMGTTSFPEALRWVPGLNVGRINTNTWSVGSRGFGFQYSDKLLVLQDGRSIYTPGFSGVFWDAHDAVMEDIERIEVIKGPGATVWGANAVNGVINIISKDARDTQGTLISAAGGPGEGQELSVRYGGRTDSDVYYRVYGKYFDRDPMVDSFGADLPEDWTALRGGFRMDWSASADNELTLQADLWTGEVDEVYREPSFAPPYFAPTPIVNESDAFNILGRWTHKFSDVSELSVQAFYENSTYRSAGTIENRETFDVEVQHRMPLGTAHDLMWGAGFRETWDTFGGSSSSLTWAPPSDTLQLATAFVQDEITLVEDRLSVTIGSKLEHHEYTGLEVQPSVRPVWMPNERQTMWAAVSRAVRTPSRHSDAGINVVTLPSFPGGPPVELTLLPSSDVDSEELIAYEAGYRVEMSDRLSVELAVFANDYDRIIGYLPVSETFEFTPVPHVAMTSVATNFDWGSTYGGEVSIQWNPTDRWRLAADYAMLNVRTSPDNPAQTVSEYRQTNLRTHVALPFDLEVMAAVAHVNETASAFDSFPGVPAYTRVDLGVTWRPSDSVELGIWGRNLLDPRHPEATGITTAYLAEIPRSFMGRVTCRF